MSSNWHGDEFFDGIRARTASGVSDAAQTLVGKMKQLVETQGPPRSAPGEAPHQDTGDLHSNIHATGVGSQGDFLTASVGSDLPYAAMLEFGTSKMAPRPFMSRALRQNQSELGQQILAGGETE